MEKESYHADYKSMYLVLFGSMTSALSAMAEKNYGMAEEILKQGQIEAEEIYMGTEE